MVNILRWIDSIEILASSGRWRWRPSVDVSAADVSVVQYVSILQRNREIANRLSCLSCLHLKTGNLVGMEQKT